MEGLPFLPGNNFTDPTKSKYHRSQTLGYKNGYITSKRPEVGIGGVPIHKNQLNEAEIDELANYNPTLTYGQAKQAPPSEFIPAHVAWDKKVLKYNAWFKQTVHESPNEHYRVRHVNIYYYLEDDSISVIEPQVENSGIPQGKLIRRQRLPKNDVGDNWTWRDINIGTNVTFYGKVFHVFDCDKWTKEFLESEGIELNPVEDCPVDPYSTKRSEAATQPKYNTPTDYDKQRQFLEMDRKVLRFFAVWDDRDNMFGELRSFIVHFYLVDDTLEIREVHKPNDGHDPFPILIIRHKVPKDRYNVKSSFPAVVMELSNQEIAEYFTPRDFKLGETVNIYGRRFFLYDCDNFTKAFYYQNFGITEFEPIRVDPEGRKIPKMEIAPYNGYGSLEDSLQSCISLVPHPPKKDFIKLMENDGKILRFEAMLDSTKPEDAGRKFIISYRLSDDMVTIYEPPVRNSGRITGKFLEGSRAAKPGSTPNEPVFYGPEDFAIGAVIEIFSHRFIITNADRYVLQYMLDHKEQFPDRTIASLREKLVDISEADSRPPGASTSRGPGDLSQIAKEVTSQIKKLGITMATRKDHMYLSAETARRGYVSHDDIRSMCVKMNLPTDPDIIHAVAGEIGADPERITLEEFRRFFES